MTKIPVSKAYAKWMAEDAERLNAMAELARKVAVTLPSKEEAEKRAFCPNGEGNGVTNTCGGGSSGETANVNNSKNDKSWIDSSGTFHAMGGSGGMYREEHQEWAEKIGETVSGLFRKGWSRVNKVDDVVWVANAEGKVPSGKQLSRLIDFGIFSGASQVVFDPGAGVKKKVLWDRSEDRAFCPTGSGGGIDNSCSSVSASDPSLKERVPFKPVGDGKNSDFIRVPSVDELTEALTGSNSSKGTKIGSAKNIEAGTPVALRIDIPAFNYSTKNMGKAIYAVTIHENKGGKGFGSPLAYEPMARLSGPVTFAAKEKEATKVATGEASKFPLATVKGNFDPSRTMPPDIDSWTPVGYDPKKAAYFYDKKTGREVMGGTDAVSVGNSVFVRVPKYGYRNAKETYRDAGFWGIEYRAADCGRDEDGKFGEKNQCQTDGSTPKGEVKKSGFSGHPIKVQESVKKVDATDSSSVHSWISPDGNIYPVRPFSGRNPETHDNWANKNVSVEGKPATKDSLLSSGWVRVTDGSGTLFVEAGKSGVSRKQISNLKDIAKSHSFDEIVRDFGKSELTLWRRSLSVGLRSTDCGRQDGGKFGPGNKCQEDGDGGTATPSAPPSPSTPTSTKMPTAQVGDPANGTAWLSPSGVFHPVPRVKPPALRLKSPSGFTTHDEWASLHGHEDGEDGLLKAGWARVAKMGGESFVQTVGRPLTSRQKKSLEDQAIIAGYDSIVHDMAPSMDDRGGPGTKHKTIWSKHDRSIDESGEERAFCATGDGGGINNSCSSSEGGVAAISRLAAAGDSTSLRQTMERSLEKHTPNEIAEKMGFSDLDRDGSFSEALRERVSISHVFQSTRTEAATLHLSALAMAAEAIPEIKSRSFDFESHQEFVDSVIRQAPEAKRSDFDGMMAACQLKTGQMTLLFDRPGTDSLMKERYESDMYSTDHPAHYIVHEYAHALQHDGFVREMLGKTTRPLTDEDVLNYVVHVDQAVQRRQWDDAAAWAISRHEESIAKGSEDPSGLPAAERIKALKAGGASALTVEEVSDFVYSVPQVVKRFPNSFTAKANKVSTYGRVSGIELAAEYWTAVTLGYKKNDPDMDAFCEEIFMPKPSQRVPDSSLPRKQAAKKLRL